MMMKIFIENWKVLPLRKKMWREKKFMYVKFIEKKEAGNPQAYLRRCVQNRRKTKENCFTNFTDQSVWRNCKRMCQILQWRFRFGWKYRRYVWFLWIWQARCSRLMENFGASYYKISWRCRKILLFFLWFIAR